MDATLEMSYKRRFGIFQGEDSEARGAGKRDSRMTDENEKGGSMNSGSCR